MHDKQKQPAEDMAFEAGKTGDARLDGLLREMAAMPVSISREEISHLVSKNAVIKGKGFGSFGYAVTGVVALTALTLYMLLPSKKQPVNAVIPHETEIAVPATAESANNNAVTIAKNANSLQTEIDATEKIEQQNAAKPTPVKKENAPATAKKEQIYLDGTTTVNLEHDGKQVSVKLSSSGVKGIVDDGKVISPADYDKYKPIIDQAYARAGIQYIQPKETAINDNENIAETIIHELYKEKLLEEGSSFDLLITADQSTVDGKAFTNDEHQKILAIVSKISGKELKGKAKIHIKH